MTSFFNNNYNNPATYSWTGEISDQNPGSVCNAGDITTAWREGTIRRINFYRRLVGLPLTTLDTTNNRNDHCQESAMMQSANAALDHTPPLSWNCYTADGAFAAGKSNIAIGSRGDDSIDGYIDDRGTFNAAVGHRRWILFPPTTAFATGDVGDRSWTGSPTDYGAFANSLWVFDNVGTRPPSPTSVVWPNIGFVPYNILPTSRRWSLSVPGANFNGVNVAASTNGNAYTVVKEAVQSGFGDNTIVFRLEDVPLGRPQADIPIDFSKPLRQKVAVCRDLLASCRRCPRLRITPVSLVSSHL